MILTEMSKLKRSTALKKEIIALLKTHHLLSASQILEKLHKSGHTVNKTSIYRNLDSFLEDNIVCQQSFNGELLYELQEHHHDHAVCENCGKIEVVPCHSTPIQKIVGFKLTHHHLTLFDVCNSCS